ncbi:MAG TPA: dienelactone hydrolase family protein [Microthrixaceae bacterium]|nr:dienelactone hydrolase family protein [Microthrixaceae bacterium]
MTVPDLPGFERRSFTHDGVTRAVYHCGEGPAVVVMAEMPGITPKVIEFAERVRDIGCSVWMPHLFGEPGARLGPVVLARAIAPGCVSKEFAAFAKGRTEPVSLWLRALARHAHAESGGPGVGAIGMCFTGGFALGMTVDESVLAPVLSQPSLPLGITRRHRADIHLSPDDLERVKQRTRDEGICVLGMRFTHDRLVPADRFATLRRELGDAFIGVEIDSSPGNPHGIPRVAHSVVTENLVADDPEHPTAGALVRVLDFFRERLLVA